MGEDLEEETVDLDMPEVEAVPGEDEDEVKDMVSVSRLTFGGEWIRSEGLEGLDLVLGEDFDDGEMNAEELVDALVKIEAYGADFFELAVALGDLEDLEDLVGLSLGDLEVWTLDLVLDGEVMGKGLENKL